MSSPQWQPDSDVSECYLCHTPYTFTYRRHHCRHCGLVVCHECSANYVSYPLVDMVATSTGPVASQPWDRYRTCDSCARELDRREAQPMAASRSAASSIPRRVEDAENLCPVCGKNLRRMYARSPGSAPTLGEFKEDHIRDCLAAYDFSKSPERTSQILVYNIPPIPEPQYQSIDEQIKPDSEKSFDKSLDSECVICLEDLEPGDKVGRLECLCVFHYKCIKDWFNKKGYGSCPVHVHHT
ncbi:hypothetical protein DICA3_F29558 [Diutina catenulata]